MLSSDATTDVCAVVATTTLAYLVAHYVLAPDRVAAFTRDPEPQGVRPVALFRLLAGALWLGAPVAVLMSVIHTAPSGWGFVPDLSLRALAWVALPAAVLVPVLFFAARAPAVWADTPRMRITTWGPRTFGINAATWAVYLVGYEYLFRGFTVLFLAEHLGAAPAIAIGTGLYAFQHLPRGAGECLGSAIMGVLFGLMTVDTGSMASAWALHMIIAMCGERFAIHHNPALHWRR